MQAPKFQNRAGNGFKYAPSLSSACSSRWMVSSGPLAVTTMTLRATSATMVALAPVVAAGATSTPPYGCVRASVAQLGVLYLALYLTALGTRGLKSSVFEFELEQFDESDWGEKLQMMHFFSWFFSFISLGSLLAVTMLVYVQDNLSRWWGYGICAIAIVAGLAVFLAGTVQYRFKRLVGSPLTQVAAVVVAAWKKRDLDLFTWWWQHGSVVGSPLIHHFSITWKPLGMEGRRAGETEVVPQQAILVIYLLVNYYFLSLN